MRTLELLPLVALALLFAAPAARAHEGPPFPLLVDEEVGPWMVSIWADPDIGVGTFYVMLDPRAGQALMPVDAIELHARREDGSDSARTYQAQQSNSAGAALQYEVLTEFPEQAWYALDFSLRGGETRGELHARVEATPPGFGRIDLLWFAGPFLIVGFLWVKVLLRKRSILRTADAGPPDDGDHAPASSAAAEPSGSGRARSRISN